MGGSVRGVFEAGVEGGRGGEEEECVHPGAGGAAGVPAAGGAEADLQGDPVQPVQRAGRAAAHC